MLHTEFQLHLSKSLFAFDSEYSYFILLLVGAPVTLLDVLFTKVKITNNSFILKM